MESRSRLIIAIQTTLDMSTSLGCPTKTRPRVHVDTGPFIDCHHLNAVQLHEGTASLQRGPIYRQASAEKQRCASKIRVTADEYG
jgi:hypothetical protein